jgi:hypothetical protein
MLSAMSNARNKRLPWAVAVLLVASCTFAYGDEIVLTGGDVIHGTIVEISSTTIVIDHPQLGRLTIDRSGVSAMTKLEAAPADAAPEVTGAPDDEEGPVPPETFEEASPEWTLSFNFGGSLTNNDEGEKLDFSVGLRATRVRSAEETDIRVNYLLKFKGDRVTDDKGTALMDQTWFVEESPWIYFALPRYDYDAFRSWRHRLQLHGGVGYRLINDEDFRLTLRGGAGLRKDFGSIEEELRPEGAAGLNLDWRPSELTTLGFGTFYLPSLENSDYRFLTNLDLAIRFSTEANLSFVTSLEWEYATDPDPSFPNHNIRLTWGLQYAF